MEAHEPPATYEQYRLLPDDYPRYEILEEVRYLTQASGGRSENKP